MEKNEHKNCYNFFLINSNLTPSQTRGLFWCAVHGDSLGGVSPLWG
jgi:hypothetical protein